MQHTNSRIILFDIDYTLIDAQILRHEIETKMVKVLKTTKATYLEAFNLYRNSLIKYTDFDPAMLVISLSLRFKIPKKEITNILFKETDIYRKSLYPDVVSTLTKLQSKYTLGIFSEGRKLYQLTKLTQSGIYPYFDKKVIFILRRKLSQTAVSKIPHNTVVVDDNPEVVHYLAKNKNLKLVLINKATRHKNSLLKSISKHIIV